MRGNDYEATETHVSPTKSPRRLEFASTKVGSSPSGRTDTRSTESRRDRHSSRHKPPVARRVGSDRRQQARRPSGLVAPLLLEMAHAQRHKRHGSTRMTRSRGGACLKPKWKCAFPHSGSVQAIYTWHRQVVALVHHKQKSPEQECDWRLP